MADKTLALQNQATRSQDPAHTKNPKLGTSNQDMQEAILALVKKQRAEMARDPRDRPTGFLERVMGCFTAVEDEGPRVDVSQYDAVEKLAQQGKVHEAIALFQQLGQQRQGNLSAFANNQASLAGGAGTTAQALDTTGKALLGTSMLMMGPAAWAAGGSTATTLGLTAAGTFLTDDLLSGHADKDTTGDILARRFGQNIHDAIPLVPLGGPFGAPAAVTGSASSAITGTVCEKGAQMMGAGPTLSQNAGDVCDAMSGILGGGVGLLDKGLGGASQMKSLTTPDGEDLAALVKHMDTGDTLSDIKGIVDGVQAINGTREE